MTCSPARLAANRANAARSTGPRTVEGKSRSRANALKHGLAAEVLRTEEEGRALEQARPKPMATWLEGEVAVLMMRIDRSHRAEDRERERAAMRAGACWGDDRGREADRIGMGLARQPDRVVRRLRGTVQGCAWLIERWGWLLDAARREGGWDEEQKALALDLRGIPEAFRGVAPDPEGQATLAEREIGGLEEAREALAGSDAFERETARRGLADGATPELRRVIRYGAALHRRLRWCCDQLRSQAPPAGPAAPAPTVPPTRPASPPRAVEARPPAARPEARLDALERVLEGRFPMQLLPAPSPTLAIAIAPPAVRRH